MGTEIGVQSDLRKRKEEDERGRKRTREEERGRGRKRKEEEEEGRGSAKDGSVVSMRTLCTIH